jgi:hypothetical protein
MFSEIKIRLNPPLYRPSRTGSLDRGCSLALCGPHAAGSPLAAARDPVRIRAARHGKGQRVAVAGSA